MTESAGESLRTALTHDRVHTDAQLTLLDQACALADELSRLELALKDVPTIINGSLGQERAHPLFAETRATRALLAKLVAQITPMTGDARRDRASRAARSRWSTTAQHPITTDLADIYSDYRNL